MLTFLRAKLGFAPLIIFWTFMGARHPAWGIGGGLVLSLVINFLNRRQGFVRSLDLGALAMLAIIAGFWLADPKLVVTHGVWLSFLLLGVVSLISVAIKKPWSADFSRADFSEQKDTPQFLQINQAITAFWGLLFIASAIAYAQHAPAWLTTGVIVLGAIVSIGGPKLALRLALRKMSRDADSYSWPAPDIKAARRAGADCDVIVIGAGIGGLTAAALLARDGLKVKVFEHHVLPGGYCHDYPRKAHYQGAPVLYRFDAGPHDFSGVWEGGTISSLMQRLGVADRIEWAHVGHRFYGPQGRIDVDRDWRAYAGRLAKLYPEEGERFLQFFEILDEIVAAMYFCLPSNGGVPGPPTTIAEMLAFPKRFPRAMHWMQRPFEEFLAAHIQTPQARNVLNMLSGYLGDGSEPFTVMQMAPVFGYFLRGGFYPMGGTNVFSNALVHAIEAAGGEVHLKTPVEKILVEDGRAHGVALASGAIVTSAAVISNADLKKTVCELLPHDATARDFHAQIQDNPPSPSAFCVQLGVDYVPDAAPSMHVSGDASKGEISVGITILSLLDPSAAPAGHATIQIMRLVPDEEAASWFPEDVSRDWKAYRRTNEYLARKKMEGDRLIAAAERALPGLRDHIVYRIDASPITYARYDWSSQGAIYGPSQGGQIRGARSPVRNLAIAGGGNAGSGVEAVMISGAKAAEVLAPGILARCG